MISLQVREWNGGYVLAERDYPAQGISPFYSTVCGLSTEEALALRRSRLFHFSGEPPSPPDARRVEAGELLYLDEPCTGSLRIRLRLPATGKRAALDVEVPGFGGMLEKAAADPASRAALVRNTGIADFAPAEAAARI